MAGGKDISKYDRMEMLKAFDETAAGVKGLLDSSGTLQKIPKIFVRPHEELSEELTFNNKNQKQVEIPVIDFSRIQNADGLKKIVEEVRIASETWGFFQVVNHGIPSDVLDGMIEGVRKFNEQDLEEKKKYYSRDFTKKVRFVCNFDLFSSKTANWRDTLAISFHGPINSQELPACCRDSTMEYSKHVEILANTLLGLLSRALGLKSDHLKDMECSKGHHFSCHYYPSCPEPELTLGSTKHSDAGFLTIVLQNQITTGLQVLYLGQWVDIRPNPEALVVNIGDLLQLVSNGKFRSVEHRVIANQTGPRISVACFFSGPINEITKVYGPIEELISEEKPPIYREVGLKEYMMKVVNSGLDECRALDYYKV